MAGKRTIAQLFVSLRLLTDDLKADIKDAQDSIGKFGQEMSKLGQGFAKAISAPMLAAGAASVIAAATIDKAHKQIQKETGKTGKALEGLQKSFDSVNRSASQAPEQVAKVIAKINQGLGLSGKPLEALSTQILQLSSIVGEDASGLVEKLTVTMNDWGVATDQQSKKLDFLYKVSQGTGIGINQLLDDMGSAETTLSDLGFSFEESAAMMGKFSKNGVDTGTVLSGLKKYLSEITGSAIPAADGLNAIIKGISEAGSQADANAIGIEAFGKKAGIELAHAIKEGHLELTTFTKALENSGSSISKTSGETQDIMSSLAELGKVAMTALQPFGKIIIDALIPAIKTLTEWMRSLGKFFAELSKPVQITIMAIAGLTSTLGSFLFLGGKLSSLITVFTALRTVMMSFIATPVGAFITGLTVLVAAGTYAWVEYKEVVKLVWNDIVAYIKKGVALVGGEITYLSTLFKELKAGNLNAGTAAKGAQESYLALQFAKIDKARKEAEKSIISYGEEEKKAGEKVEQASKKTADLNAVLEVLSGSHDKAGKEAKKHAEELAKLRTEWEQTKTDFSRNQLGDSLNKQIDQAIDKLDTVKLDSLKDELRKNISAGIEEGYKDKFGKAIPAGEISEQVAKETEAKIDEINEKIKEKQKEAYKEGVEFWRNTFENAITGTKFNLKDMFQQVAVGFAAELAQSLTQTLSKGFLEGLLKPQDLGGKLAESLMGGFDLGGLLGGSGLSGIGPLADGAKYGKMIGTSAGEGLATTAKGWGTMAGQALGLAGISYIIGSNAIKNGALKAIQGKGNSQSNTDTILASNPVTFWVNPILEALGLNSVGGYMKKLFGGGNKETLARNNFIDGINKMVKEIAGGSLILQDSFGKWKEVTKDFQIFGGSKAFNDGKGFQNFNNLDSQSQSAFTGVAALLKQTLGLTDLNTGQAAAMLTDNLGGSINNLRQLVFSLKLSFEDAKKAMLDTAEQGKITWTEYNQTVSGLGEAFKPGLVALGDVKGAVEELRASANKGLPAVKGVKDTAQELLEAGVTQLRDVGAFLQAQGYAANEANAIQQSFIESGAKTVKEIANATNEMAGGIAGNIGGKGFQYAQSDIGKGLKEMVKDITSINDIKFSPKELLINVKTTGDTKVLDGTDASSIVKSAKGNIFEGLTKYAKGGIVNAPTLFGHTGGLGLMGEAGAEAVMPLTRVNGKLGVHTNGMKSGNTFIINIDATNAENGVEMTIINAIESMKSDIINQTVQLISEVG